MTKSFNFSIIFFFLTELEHVKIKNLIMEKYQENSGNKWKRNIMVDLSLFNLN
jgi:hypothetical protein